MQSSPTYFHNEMVNDRVPIGPVKRQVAEAKKKSKKEEEA
jgi:hypothetical protein